MFILIFMFWALQSPLSHVKTVPVSDERILEPTDMLVIGGNAWITGLNNTKIFAVDIESGKVSHVLGERRGRGPGELNAPIQDIFDLDGTLALLTRDKVLHFFREDASYVKRVPMKQSFSIIADRDDQRYVVCAVSDLFSPAAKSYFEIGLIDKNFENYSIPTGFGTLQIHRNAYQNQCLLDGDSDITAYAVNGYGHVHFRQSDGSVRTLDLSVADDIEYDQPKDFGMLTEPLKRLGVTDFRMPRSMILTKISSGRHFTLIRGAFQAGKSRKQYALVRHDDWSISYIDLPHHYRDVVADGSHLYALRSVGSETQIDIFQVSGR